VTRPITVGAPEVGDLLTALHALGLPPAALCRAVGLTLTVLRDATARLPASVPVRLLAEAAARTNDPLIGLHAGQVARPRGLIAYLLLSHPRLAEGLRQVAQFSSLPLDTLRMELRRRPHPVSLVIDPGEALEEPQHLTDYLLMLVIRLLQRTVGADFAPREVHVRHAPWSDLSAAARAFGCVVRCRQPENRLVLPAGALQARSHLGNPLIADQIAQFAESLRARKALPATFHDRVAAVTRGLLIRGVRADSTTAARELHVSERTLRRRLADEQTTFKAVRDGVLWEVVEALLSNRALKVEAVALSVGFADVAAFSNAFKRWAGTSPTQYRERLVARASGARRTRRAPRARL
jgi:AraC-like DNA-binding protein